MFLPLINKDKNFIVFWNAKAGCSAVKRWYLGTVDIDPNSVSPHKFLASRQSMLTAPEIKTSYSDYYKFIVCRNPWRRIVSYYKNKKVAVWWKNKTWPIDVRINNTNSEDFSFRDLVTFVCKTPDHFLEQHIQSQTSGLDNVKFDKIVKLEDYSRQMNLVCDELGIDHRDFSNPNKTLETDNKSLVCDVRPKEFNGNNMPSYECFYDEELRQMVAEKFKNDIKYFNYKFED
jgi:hypothetical protein|tara:strand:- start:5051 stop:5743 length:693 start_codon:yes stop_codon:yes gene_type:complete